MHRIRRSLRSVCQVVPLLALGQLLATQAWAIEVMCSDGPAACSISNDPFPEFECSCNGAPSSGSTGASENPWADLSEAELTEACEMMLPDACPAGDTDIGTSGGNATDAGTGPVGESASDSNSGPDTGDPGSGSVTDSSTDSGTDDSNDNDDDDKGCSVTAARPSSGALLLLVLGLSSRRRLIRLARSRRAPRPY